MKEFDIDPWFVDPTEDLPPNVPRLNEDPDACSWEAKRRYEMIKKAQIYAIGRLPGWVQKWLRESELCYQQNRDDGMMQAMYKHMPEFVPGVSEKTFEYYDELVPHLLKEHYQLIQEVLIDESDKTSCANLKPTV